MSPSRRQRVSPAVPIIESRKCRCLPLSDLIQPVLQRIVALLHDMEMPDGLDPFRTVGMAWTGILVNPPGAWVLPVRTAFRDEGEGTTRSQIHSVTIRLGIVGDEPEKLTNRVLRYVQAVDAAITGMQDTDWPD